MGFFEHALAVAMGERIDSANNRRGSRRQGPKVRKVAERREYSTPCDLKEFIRASAHVPKEYMELEGTARTGRWWLDNAEYEYFPKNPTPLPSFAARRNGWSAPEVAHEKDPAFRPAETPARLTHADLLASGAIVPLASWFAPVEYSKPLGARYWFHGLPAFFGKPITS